MKNLYIMYFSNDGMSFLEVSWMVSASGDPGIPSQYREPLEPAVRFFEQGNLIHYFSVYDFMRNPNSIVYSVSHAIWDFQNERYYDRDNNALRVTTRDGRIVTFDLSTGMIISNRRDPILQRVQRRMDDPWFWDDFFDHPVVIVTISTAFFSTIILILVIIIKLKRSKAR